VLHWPAAELCGTGVAKISGESGQWIDGRRFTKVRAMHVLLRNIVHSRCERLTYPV